MLILIGAGTVFAVSSNSKKKKTNNINLVCRKYSMSQSPFLGPGTPVLQEEKKRLFKTVPGFQAELTSPIFPPEHRGSAVSISSTSDTLRVQRSRWYCCGCTNNPTPKRSSSSPCDRTRRLPRFLQPVDQARGTSGCGTCLGSNQRSGCVCGEKVREFSVRQFTQKISNPS